MFYLTNLFSLFNYEIRLLDTESENNLKFDDFIMVIFLTNKFRLTFLKEKYSTFARIMIPSH